MDEVLLVLIQRLLFGTYSSVLNAEVSSFHGVGIEEFHCIQRCWNGGVPLHTEVSSLHHSIQKCLILEG